LSAPRGDDVSLRPITRENWRAALQLAVHPDQQRFVADASPIVAIALAKAYVGAGGAIWAPYGIYAGETMIGFVALAHEVEAPGERWIFHFFVDQRFQGRGYGKATLRRLVDMVRREQPRCQSLWLVVHPENYAAQHLYTGAGFSPTGATRWGEPEYVLALRDAD
jgi:diamine N-acetyltransferase